MKLFRTDNLVIHTFLIAIAYAITAKLSLDLASLPGSVTAVWLPSSIILTSVLILGKQAFIGISLGAIGVNTLEILRTLPTLSIVQVILLNLILWLAECLFALVGVALIKKFSFNRPLFEQPHTVLAFIVAVIIAPMAAATPSVMAWCLNGVIAWKDFGIAWLTWWLSGALAQILFTPTLLLLCQSPQLPWRHHRRETGVILSLILALSWLTFGLGYQIEYILIPVLIWAAFRLGNLTSNLCVSLVAAIGIVATAHGYGPFIRGTPHQSLLLLQSFTAVCSLTVLILSAVIHQRRSARSALVQTLTTLEQQVAERTEALRQTEAQLNGFFSSAPVGMCIVDRQLRFVRVNEVLAAIDGVAIDDHLDKTVREILPELAPTLEPLHQQVLETGEPFLNQEVSGEIFSASGIQRTWLVSYFPILDSNNIPFRIGIFILEISDRKRIELELQQQARVDSLTQIANRRYFDEMLLSEWRRCSRARQPLSLILCDVDEFKAYNDSYGHPMGDQCLGLLAQVFRDYAKRSADLVARYGGEEFALLLPDTTAEGALYIATAIRSQLHQLKIPHRSSRVCSHVTVSMGVATCIPLTLSQTDDLILQADQALYAAKQQGRDRIIHRLMPYT